MPTQLVYAPADVPWLLRAVMAAMAVLVFVSGVQDAVAAFKLRKREPYPASAGEIG